MSEFDRLSIKQLKQVLNAKCQELPTAEANTIRSSMLSIVEKGALLSLCRENVEEGEIDKLLATPVGSAAAPAPQSATVPERPFSSTTSTTSASSQPKFSASQYRSQVSSQMGSPDQLRYQAACMRRDPGAFRRSNPEAASFTDEQINAMAANLEQMASDPSKLKAYQEQVKNMSDEDIERMQRMQQKVPPSADGTSMANNIDRFIAALQGDPKDARAMLKSMPGFPATSDETFDNILGQLRQMDPATLRQLIMWSEKLKTYYDSLDRKLGNKGRAKYVIYGATFLFLVFFALILWKVVAFVVGSFWGDDTVVEASSNFVPATPANAAVTDNVDSEFDL